MAMLEFILESMSDATIIVPERRWFLSEGHQVVDEEIRLAVHSIRTPASDSRT